MRPQKLDRQTVPFLGPSSTNYKETKEGVTCGPILGPPRGPKNGTAKTAQKPNTSSSKNLPSNRGGPVLRSQEWWKKMVPKRGPLTRARFDSKHSAPGATQKKQCCEIVSAILKNPCSR